MITAKIKVNNSPNNSNPLYHLTKLRNHPFPPITIKYASTFEVEYIVSSLKKKIPAATMEYQQKY
jgi:hypothetical protein